MARRSSSIKMLSTADIRQELSRRQRSLPKLTKKRASLSAQLAAIDSQIEALGGDSKTSGGSTAGRASRSKNSMTLVQALEKVLSGKQMSIGEAINAVKAAGYKTESKSFRISVNATLLKFKKKFKKVARGIYTAT